jgi:hypothetical protein
LPSYFGAEDMANLGTQNLRRGEAESQDSDVILLAEGFGGLRDGFQRFGYSASDGTDRDGTDQAGR